MLDALDLGSWLHSSSDELVGGYGYDMSGAVPSNSGEGNYFSRRGVANCDSERGCQSLTDPRKIITGGLDSETLSIATAATSRRDNWITAIQAKMMISG